MTEPPERRERVRARRFPQMAREIYQEEGYRIIEPGVDGAPYGLHMVDWHPDTFIAKKGRRVEIPLLSARMPGTGAFPRLIEKLAELDLIVRVVAPLGYFRDHLERQGWAIEEFSSHGEVWRPPTG